ncbi:hypothetical protein H4S14_002590 [Agrobacterium vitis]|nr:hypothetical protein [Agrobacterium vitis]MBE1438834.1 hypothetical protein [Agrobacterium vitis]
MSLTTSPGYLRAYWCFSSNNASENLKTEHTTNMATQTIKSWMLSCSGMISPHAVAAATRLAIRIVLDDSSVKRACAWRTAETKMSLWFDDPENKIISFLNINLSGCMMTDLNYRYATSLTGIE